MYPAWLIRSLERAQSLFRLPSGTVLGIEYDTIVHFTLVLAIVAYSVTRSRARLGIWIVTILALVKESLDVGILLNYNDVDRFIPDILMDLLAAAMAIGAGVWIGRLIMVRRTRAEGDGLEGDSLEGDSLEGDSLEGDSPEEDQPEADRASDDQSGGLSTP